MAVEMQAALVGGAVGGLVVLIGVLLEQRLTRKQEHRSRRQVLVGSVLGDYIEAIAMNTRASAMNDVGQVNASGNRIASAQGQLLVFGTPAIAKALENFARSGRNMGSSEGQNALLDLFQAIRDEVLPNEARIPKSVVKDLLFERA